MIKLRYVIALVVVAVLITVVIEESRLSEMRAEIIRLRSLVKSPEDADDNQISGAEEVVGQQNSPSVPELPSDGPLRAPNSRVPEEFPEPDEETVRALALGANSALHYELALSNRERAYFERLMEQRNSADAAYAQAWIASSPEIRAAKNIPEELRKIDTQIEEFLGSEENLFIFQKFVDRRSARTMTEEIRQILEQQGIVFAIDKETQLIEALHLSMMETGATDWDSLDALPMLLKDDALDRFESDWQAQTEFLKAAIREFLADDEVTAVLDARRQLKASRLENLSQSIEILKAS